MKFVIDRFENIPCMAWCVVMTKGLDTIRLLCGNKVECVSDAFVEGVWDDSFEDMNFDSANFFCGSGGKICNNHLTLSSPCHGMERICYIKTEDRLFASNSVPFLLAVSGNELDKEYLYYEKDFCSIKNGLTRYCSSIPLANNKSFHLHYFCNIVIDNNLNVLVKSKPVTNPAETFEEYHNDLLNSLLKIKENATDKKRNAKFGIVTTVSKGYDSACCAAMAKKIGCTTVLTFNSPLKYECDRGDEVAKQLGYSNIKYGDANHYIQSDEPIEAFHTATGELGTTICFEAFEEDFKDNIVFYGERGDQFWSKEPIDPNSEFRFANQLVPGIGMAEWRLKVGFVLLPIAFYKGVHWQKLFEISNSDDMKDWSVGGNYDRPIPRRICEEMGVDRSSFGQSKKGAGFNYNRDTLNRIKKRMSEKSFKSFVKFMKANKRRPNIKATINYFRATAPDYFNYALTKVHLKGIFKKKNWDVINPNAPSYLTNWGISECTKYYLMALKVSNCESIENKL